MSSEVVVHSKRHLHLYFSKQDQLQLEKVTFSDPASSQTLISIRADGTEPTGAYGLFPWNSAVRAMCLLLARSSDDTCAPLSGGPSSFAAAFDNALKRKASWLEELFGKDEDGQPVFSRIFMSTRAKKNASISLNGDFFARGGVMFSVNDEPLSAAIGASIAAQLENVVAPRVMGRVMDFPARPRTQSRASKLSNELRSMRHEVVSPTLMKLFSDKLEDQLSTHGAERILSRLEELVTREVPIQNSQHTEITVLNGDRDMRVRFQFEIINAGFRPITTRTHNFWFDRGQDDVELGCFDGDGQKLPFEVNRTSAYYREVNITLEKPLQPLEKFRYEVAFTSRGTQDVNCFYIVGTRTITKRISLSIIGCKDFAFQDVHIIHETSDGYFRDDAPSFVITQEGDHQRLHWEYKSPPVGDAFRTFWINDDQRTQAIESTTEVAEKQLMQSAASPRLRAALPEPGPQ